MINNEDMDGSGIDEDELNNPEKISKVIISKESDKSKSIVGRKSEISNTLKHPKMLKKKS
jgi:hypothetical protein